MDPTERKRVLRLLSNGLYVVTTARQEEVAAATITWLTQTSFEPPLLVAGIRAGSHLSDTLQHSKRAVIHVVADDQTGVAKRFFSRPELDVECEPPTLAGLSFASSEYGPVLDVAGAWACCRVAQTVDCGGDHELVVFEVLDVGSRAEVEPLTVRDSPWEYGG